MYKRQIVVREGHVGRVPRLGNLPDPVHAAGLVQGELPDACLLYTSDAADERSSVDLGGRRIIKKKTRGESPARGRTRRKVEDT